MTPRLLTISAVLSAALAGGDFVQTAPAPAQTVDGLLRTHFRFSASQIAEVHRGRVVTMALPGSIDREIVAVGAVRIDTPAERLLEVFSDIEALEAGGGFVKTTRISDPPREEDFATLTLPPEDIADLRHCRPGSCELKLGQQAFDRLSSIDWRAPDADARVHRFVRRMAFDLIQAYRTSGSQAFATSHDKRPPTQVASEFAEMVTKTPWLTASLPGLVDYLLRYPNANRPAALREYFYWSVVEFGLKKVLRLNHVAMYPLGEGRLARWALVNRLIYASHYFQNALEVRMLVDDAERPGRAHYLLVLNVARPDGLTGLFGGLVRYKVRSGSRDALRKTIVITKRRCETPQSATSRTP